MPSTIIYDAECSQCNTYLGKRTLKEGQINTFCNSSCAASFNNCGIRRHGSPPSNCLYCGVTTSGSRNLYCSNKCQRAYEHKQQWPDEEEYLIWLKANNRDIQVRYYAKLKSQTPEQTPEERKEIIEFFKNCPEGYEVDHIYPISKGGLHVISNLQYLTQRENRIKGNKILDNTNIWGYVKEQSARNSTG